MKKQQLLLNKVAEHVTEEFGLGDKFMITNFKAKDFSVTMDSPNYEITVKCKGDASNEIFEKYTEELVAIKAEEEVNEEE